MKDEVRELVDDEAGGEIEDDEEEKMTFVPVLPSTLQEHFELAFAGVTDASAREHAIMDDLATGPGVGTGAGSGSGAGMGAVAGPAGPPPAVQHHHEIEHTMQQVRGLDMGALLGDVFTVLDVEDDGHITRKVWFRVLIFAETMRKGAKPLLEEVYGSLFDSGADECVINETDFVEFGIQHMTQVSRRRPATAASSLGFRQALEDVVAAKLAFDHVDQDGE